MSTTANTSFSGNRMASHWHRVLGKACYFLDSDHIELSDGTIGDTMKEYTYKNGVPSTVAMIDFKYPGKSLSDSYSAIQYQIHSTENEFKTPIPFFMVIYYLDKDIHEIPMYYVIPANVPARLYFDKCKLSDAGAWMTVKKFSKFQYALRNQPWNQNEVIDDKNAAMVGLRPNMTLRDLPDEPARYPLPKMNFSWLTKEI